MNTLSNEELGYFVNGCCNLLEGKNATVLNKQNIYSGIQKIVTDLNDNDSKQTEKIDERCRHIVKQFDKHFNKQSVEQLKILAQRIASNTGDKQSGAYEAFHALFEALKGRVNKILESHFPKESKQLKSCIANLERLDAYAESYIEQGRRDINIHLKIPGLQKNIGEIIVSNLEANDLKNLRLVSKNYKKLTGINVLQSLNKGKKTIQDLGIKNLKQLATILGADQINNLTRLDLTGCEKQDLQKCGELFPKLEYLILEKNYNNNDLYQIKSLFFEKIYISNCDELLDLVNDKSKLIEVVNCKNLKSIVAFNKNLNGINIQKCLKIDKICLMFCKIVELNFLENCPNLNYLTVCECNKIKDLSILNKCNKIKFLNVGECDLNFNRKMLSNCKYLEEIQFRGCKNINLRDLSCLRSLSKLKKLDLIGCDNLKPNFETVISLEDAKEVLQLSYLTKIVCPNGVTYSEKEYKGISI